MPERSERLEADVDFANLEDVDDLGPSEIGQRRLTDLSGRVIEAARGSWFAWLVAAIVVAGGIVGTTSLLVGKIWPLEDELAQAQAELAAIRQEKERLEQELATHRTQKEELERARAALGAELTRLQSEKPGAAATEVDSAEEDKKKAAAKKPKKKKGRRR